VSQTPLVQVVLAAPALHFPLSVGLACAGSVGICVPLPTFGVQKCVVSLHQLVAVQSASTKQVPAPAQTLALLHKPLRQTLGPVRIVHGPSPFARPHFPSGSHAAARQTVAALAVVHAPSPFA
jgi:hypothetical protein